MSDHEILELKPISTPTLSEAITRADACRLYNDPELAETICLEVFAVQPDNQHNLRTLILVIGDLLVKPGSRVSAHEGLAHVARLESAYERAFYSGLLAEREGRAFLLRTHGDAYASFRQAMDWYEQADALGEPDNHEARLRYNACVRTLEREELEPPQWEQELPLE